MDIDKYIGGRKVRRMGHSSQENEEIERKAILSIRSNSQALNSLFDEISMYSPSMISPTASPIKHHTDSNTTFNYTPIKQFMQAPTFKKSSKGEKQSINPEIKSLKKKSISSVHFNTYMQPIGKVSEKFKGVLQKEKKLREMQQQRELYHINHMKAQTKEEYQYVQPKYRQYEQRNSSKEEAIANRLVEKEESQMSGVTFMPKINKNIKIQQPFQERMLRNQKKKELKSGKIIQQSTKNETYHPKINKHKQCQSKIKSIWLKQSNTGKQYALSNSMQVQSHNLSDFLSEASPSTRLKMTRASDLDFMIKR